MARKYDLKRRAERQDATRLRIVEVTIGLHETIGAAGTTITEIAERAGVGRLTVYRHFPDQKALLTACTGHWFAQHPPPDPETWRDVADPADRLTSALGEVYAYFAVAGTMLTRAEQDAPSLPVLAELMEPSAVLWGRMRDVVAEAWPDEPTTPAATVRRAAIGHALALSTWRSLVREQGLTEQAAIDVMRTAIRCVA